MSELSETHVVTCFLRNKGEILLLRRSDDVGYYTGRWDAVSGYVEEDEYPRERALEEVEEKTKTTHSMVREGEDFEVNDKSLGKRWVIYPFMFDSETRDVKPNWETSEHEWCSPTRILRRETVPELWETYRRVAPSVDSVSEDDEHGSSYISIRALEVLRDSAAVTVCEKGNHSKQDIEKVAESLISARSDMAVVRNRVNRVMHECESVEGIERKAHDEIRKAVEADRKSARKAADIIGESESYLLTLSRSGTVMKAIDSLNCLDIIIAESRPSGEGADVADDFANGNSVTLIPDSAVPYVISYCDVDAVIVGADTIFEDGSVVNKVGTLTAALGAEKSDVPFYVLSAIDKINHWDSKHEFNPETTNTMENKDDVEVFNPLFDLTPPGLIDGIVTEREMLDTGDVEEIADELRVFAEWNTED